MNHIIVLKSGTTLYMQQKQTPTWTNDSKGMYAIFKDVQVEVQGKAMMGTNGGVMTFPSVKVTRDSIDVELFATDILADQPEPEYKPDTTFG